MLCFPGGATLPIICITAQIYSKKTTKKPNNNKKRTVVTYRHIHVLGGSFHLQTTAARCGRARKHGLCFPTGTVREWRPTCRLLTVNDRKEEKRVPSSYLESLASTLSKMTTN